MLGCYNPPSGIMVCNPWNVQEVCVKLEVQSFANYQVLPPTFLKLPDELIGNILRFCSPACQLHTAESLPIEHFVHQLHNETRFLFAELRATIDCFAASRPHLTAAVKKKVLHLLSEPGKDFWDGY